MLGSASVATAKWDLVGTGTLIFAVLRKEQFQYDTPRNDRNSMP